MIFDEQFSTPDKIRHDAVTWYLLIWFCFRNELFLVKVRNLFVALLYREALNQGALFYCDIILGKSGSSDMTENLHKQLWVSLALYLYLSPAFPVSVERHLEVW